MNKGESEFSFGFDIPVVAIVVIMVVLFGSATAANYFNTRRYEACIAHHPPKECQ
jgi:hypothetical protein